jgi:hypothetical protein
MTTQLDRETLEMALAGYEQKKAAIEAKIDAIRQQQMTRLVQPMMLVEAPNKPKRRVSAAGKKAIAAAQRKRWAAYKKAHKKVA